MIDAMSKAFMDSDGEVKSALRVMFNSDTFRNARSKKVKSPIEMVAGVLMLAGDHTDFKPGLANYPQSTTFTNGSPWRKRSRFSQKRSSANMCETSLRGDECGVMMTLGSDVSSTGRSRPSSSPA